ncbi:hypothetical protein GCM10007094_44250 [Pseudovibrio japonicus]|uniref:Type IV / VI secretion system DotU domain-containing protein n=1 Tax=Pseudovibrio japonicus TaxID=366534 RepID=A0ABQ3EU06_9HYPH|nr:type IVB secretion system protein IcmH/DotU [Pseudovibrio japonicus]GHB50133.1 hypothetical protein GCM10007094_44250 [Pseudovibrio japonicus]
MIPQVNKISQFNRLPTPALTGDRRELASDTAIPVLVKFSSRDLQLLYQAQQQFSGYENRLMNASADLLAVCGTIARMQPADKLDATHVELKQTIIDLKYKVVQLDYPPSVAENLCLLYAIVLDEFILSSPWSANRGWENWTLAADLFGFRDGGDRFYSITERVLMQPKALRELLEVIYTFLKLGYRGKYKLQGETERNQLIARLEASLTIPLITNEQNAPSQDLDEPAEPIVGISNTAKCLLAGAALILISLSSWTYTAFERQQLREYFVQSDMAPTKGAAAPLFNDSTLINGKG